MNLRSLVALAAVTAGCLINVSAQDCGTDERHRQLKAAHPEIAVIEKQLDAYTQQYLSRGRMSQFAKTTADTAYYDIPVVVHIVHDYGQEYLNDNTIMSAVDRWNEVYQGRNADTVDVIPPFKKWVGNPRIRLHLATKDPQGRPTKGITRRRSYHAFNASDESKMDAWPQKQYLNIWLISSFSSPGLGGYSYYPSTADFMPWIDGVIALASGALSGRLMEHEIGHYLNLMHLWGSTNSPGVACGDDAVDDTPPTMGHVTTGCTAASLYDVTCATGYFKTYTVNSVTTVVDYPDTTNAQNIMDYTQCQKMFSKGQGERMRAALNSPVAGRNNLWDAANLALTGANVPGADLPPIAEFSVNRAFGNATPLTREPLYFAALGCDLEFSFTNRSWNDTITSVQWAFSNSATLPAPTTNNVRTSFAQPGWVQVALTATGNNTGSTTITNPRTVYVADSVMRNPDGYYQEFNGPTAMDQWPAFNYYNNNFKWEQFTGAGLIDNTSLRYRSYDARTAPESYAGGPDGDRDDVFTPGFDLSAYANKPLYLNFYTAGATARGYTTAPDVLEIAISNNLGASWQSIDTIEGEDLFTVKNVTGDFVPTSGQWTARTVNVPMANRTEKVFFRLRFRPTNQSNNLYLDRFSITQAPTEVLPLQGISPEVSLFPNPARVSASLRFTTASAGAVTIELRDILGRKLYGRQTQYAANSAAVEEIPLLGLPAGMYLVELRLADRSVTKRLQVK